MRYVIRAVGEIFLTLGVIGLLFIGYLIWGTAHAGRTPPSTSSATS